jgi:hypothetical protein
MGIFVGCACGLISPVGTSIYDPTVRATGFSFAHNVAMGILGGLSPTVITSIGMSLNSDWKPGFGAGYWLLSMAGATVIGCIGLSWLCPQCTGWKLVEVKQGAETGTAGKPAEDDDVCIVEGKLQLSCI